jgi:N-carbamoyl-L-amino-acid hydrolase
VATVGTITLRPNLVNVVANRARLTVDLRNTDGARLLEARHRVMAFLDELAIRERVSINHRTLADFPPVDFSAEVTDLVVDVAKRHGHSVRRMPSGAGHDAQILQRCCPASMIFVPSVGGISHNVREFTNESDIAAGANVLLHTLLTLAS